MFRTGDGWFTYNIVTNARNVEPWRVAGPRAKRYAPQRWIDAS